MGKSISSTLPSSSFPKKVLASSWISICNSSSLFFMAPGMPGPVVPKRLFTLLKSMFSTFKPLARSILWEQEPLPRFSKGFQEVFKYRKTLKQHPFETPGRVFQIWIYDCNFSILKASHVEQPRDLYLAPGWGLKENNNIFLSVSSLIFLGKKETIVLSQDTTGKAERIVNSLHLPDHMFEPSWFWVMIARPMMATAIKARETCSRAISNL